MVVKLKFLGALRHAVGKEALTLDCEDGASILDILTILTSKDPTLRGTLLSGEIEEPKPSALILINGREISVLRGLETEVADGDEVVFVPIVHGG